MKQLNNPELMTALQKEIPILTAQIRSLYAELDKKFHLSGASVPITFGFDKDLLGSYTKSGNGEKEHFHFSLYFVGYAVEHPLSKEDRIDLYKHDYDKTLKGHRPEMASANKLQVTRGKILC